MKKIIEMQFGSHVYGTNVPTSDTDIKAIYLPTAEEILLQRVKATINVTTKVDDSKRNSAEDIDMETFSFQQYLKLLMEGQTVALDMLFTPNSFYRLRSPEWTAVKVYKDKFIHKGTSSFVGYTKQQAAKYGIKGSRVAAARNAVEFLDSLLFKNNRLQDYYAEILIFVEFTDSFDKMLGEKLIKIVEIPNRVGTMEKYLEVCNRKVPFHATVKFATQQMQELFDRYGERALLAEKNEGIDWKALMHAVRVAREAQELLLSGNITFPRPEKDLLLKIRKGELDYKEVAEIIEQGLLDITEAQSKSTLQAEPDRAFADQLVVDTYKRIIKV